MRNQFFQWDSHFVTGHKKIDKEHYALIEIINDLMKLSFQTEKVEDKDIEGLKTQLTDYTLNHFQTEEKLMQECSIDCRHKDEHEKFHKDFINKVSGFFDASDNLKSKKTLDEINEFLIRWLAYHILSMDKSLVRQLDRIKNEKISPQEAYDKELQDFDSNTEPLLKALKSLFYLVSQKNSELEIINEGLELKIKDRTKALEESNLRLEEISLIDELTKLPNRRFIIREIEQLISNRERYGTTFSVIFIDLDKFKAVNDNHGHEYGDKVLKWVSNFINNNTRKNDILCRLGGDEFVIIAPHCNGVESLVMAQKLLALVSHLNDSEKLPYWNPSFSLGIIEMNDSIDSVSDLLTKVDYAMYESKKSGGNAATLFSK